jgi:hypothetical protein
MEIKMTITQKRLLQISSVLWGVWGLVHIMAGTIVLSADTQTGFSAIADAVYAEDLIANYHPAIGAILNQHAWNLFWFGSVTTVGAFFIWRASPFAIAVTALIGGFADVGYFVFLDIGGFVNFMPGTVMTIISATAIMLSMAVYVQIRPRAPL